MSKVEVTKLMRTLTVASTIIVNTIPLKAANVDVVRAILSTPCTLMGGVCAFLYYKLCCKVPGFLHKPDPRGSH